MSSVVAWIFLSLQVKGSLGQYQGKASAYVEANQADDGWSINLHVLHIYRCLSE
jgi:hypothetical protein